VSIKPAAAHLAAIHRRIFQRSPVALLAPFLEVGFGAACVEYLPCPLKSGAGLIERVGVPLVRSRDRTLTTISTASLRSYLPRAGDGPAMHVREIDSQPFLRCGSGRRVRGFSGVMGASKPTLRPKQIAH